MVFHTTNSHIQTNTRVRTGRYASTPTDIHAGEQPHADTHARTHEHVHTHTNGSSFINIPRYSLFRSMEYRSTVGQSIHN